MPIPANVSRDIPILIIDDFTTMRRIVRNSLKQLGFTNIIEATDGQDALNHLETSNFECIITEWNMPTINGSDLVKIIKADEKHKKKPLLVITTESQRSSVIATEKKGISTYIVKPFSTEILESKLETLLSSNDWLYFYINLYPDNEIDTTNALKQLNHLIHKT